jgi:hypothetical protein
MRLLRPKANYSKPIGQRQTKISPTDITLTTVYRSKFGRPTLLLLALEALEAVRAANNGELPALGSDAQPLIDAATTINAARDEPKRLDAATLDAAAPLLTALARGARAVLNPMAALFGGIVGQEVVKAATGKFHPVHQWLLYESLESLPPPPAAADANEFVAPAGQVRARAPVYCGVIPSNPFRVFRSVTRIKLPCLATLCKLKWPTYLHSLCFVFFFFVFRSTATSPLISLARTLGSCVYGWRWCSWLRVSQKLCVVWHRHCRQRLCGTFCTTFELNYIKTMCMCVCI